MHVNGSQKKKKKVVLLGTKNWTGSGIRQIRVNIPVDAPIRAGSITGVV